ncbi:hypothetical protein BDR26DRAFT_867723 [Obelidium mucronatum]|nr:hypothetical protein BDR26DRAFT_867723 [Obelidium mucronatum]
MRLPQNQQSIPQNTDSMNFSDLSPRAPGLIDQACYTNPNPTAVMDYITNMPTTCGAKCKNLKKPYALVGLNLKDPGFFDCFCIAVLPSSKYTAGSRNCQTVCPDYTKLACGGPKGAGFYSGFASGYQELVEEEPEPVIVKTTAAQPPVKTTTAVVVIPPPKTSQVLAPPPRPIPEPQPEQPQPQPQQPQQPPASPPPQPVQTQPQYQQSGSHLLPAPQAPQSPQPPVIQKQPQLSGDSKTASASTKLFPPTASSPTQWSPSPINNEGLPSTTQPEPLASFPIATAFLPSEATSSNEFLTSPSIGMIVGILLGIVALLLCLYKRYAKLRGNAKTNHLSVISESSFPPVFQRRSTFSKRKWLQTPRVKNEPLSFDGDSKGLACHGNKKTKKPPNIKTKSMSPSYRKWIHSKWVANESVLYEREDCENSESTLHKHPISPLLPSQDSSWWQKSVLDRFSRSEFGSSNFASSRSWSVNWTVATRKETKQQPQADRATLLI